MYLQETGQPYDKETINNLQYDFQGLGIHSPKNTMTNGKPDTINFGNVMSLDRERLPL
nr:hypothetical protein [Mannheimia haemolytica]